MLEWIILGLLGASALAGSNKKKISRNASSSSATSQWGAQSTGGAEDFSTALAAWRSQWEPTIDKTRWIPSGAAARVLNEYPRPGSSFELKFGGASGHKELRAEFDAHNQAHLEREKLRLREFFGTVEKAPLTDEQILACVCMDDSVQIVAAAGSGKTSTMVAKTGYALRQGLAGPEHILLLAFNEAAATELRTRVQDRLADIPCVERVTAKTFHAFGMDVIAKATGKKPSLAPWLEGAGQDLEMIVQIVHDLAQREPPFKDDWDLFRTVYGRDVGKWGERAEPEDVGQGRRGYRTADGKIVKSKEERHIADWLFYHNVPYEYEREYEFATASEQFGQYRPDFYYPDIKLYHEHFALSGEGEAPAHFKGDYLAGVAWKRHLHTEKGTRLFETTSDQISRGVALNRLKNELSELGVELKFNPTREGPGTRPVSDKDLASTIRVFQQHVKSNGLTDGQLEEALRAHSKDGHAPRLALFLEIFRRISAEWDLRLKNGKYVDFEDMLLFAAEHIEAGRFESPFTIILADEFQDSSRARIRLLKALAIAPKEPTHLCVVGDDWQGINRFAGADISVMTEFEKTFEHATTLTLQTTFRCPQVVCDVSSEFVQANPAQIRKVVRTTNSYDKTPLLAYGFAEPEEASGHIAVQLAQMHHLVKAGRLKPSRGEWVRVLLLGRYRSDEPQSLGRWQARFGDHLKIDFRTVHRSKGLEAEYVMILNVIEGQRGFPSQIEDDPVLQLAMPTPDPYAMAEERRLFYVALTRASRQVRLYTSLARPSRFLVELVSRQALAIEAIGGEALEACPKCAIGVITLRSGEFGAFQSCSTYPRCDFRRAIRRGGEGDQQAPTRLDEPVPAGDLCPICQRGSMLMREGRYGKFLGCSDFPVCKTTAPLH